MFSLQLQQPTKGDWVSSCINNLKTLQISETFEEIKSMSKNQFKKSLKNKIKEKALQYLKGKQGSKGRDIDYKYLQMSEYLLPNDHKLTINDQRKIFAIKNRMVDIPENFPSKQNDRKKCKCGLIENMEHIYLCKKMNSKQPEIEYKNIYNGQLKQQIEVYKRFNGNIEEREKLKNIENPQEILNCDPLYSIEC